MERGQAYREEEKKKEVDKNGKDTKKRGGSVE